MDCETPAAKNTEIEILSGSCTLLYKIDRRRVEMNGQTENYSRLIKFGKKIDELSLKI